METLMAGKCLFNHITDEVYKILFVEKENDVLYGIELNKTIAYPVAFSITQLMDLGIEIREDKQSAVALPPATDKQKEELEDRWRIIRDFVLDEPACYVKSVRTSFAADAARQENCTVYRINQMLYRYWTAGKNKNGLLPQTTRRGGRGKSKRGQVGRKSKVLPYEARYQMSENDLQRIRSVIKKTYNKHIKYSLIDGYQELLKTYFTKEDGKTLKDAFPSKNQFDYYARKEIDIQKRYGFRAYSKDIKGHTGSSRTEARGPGDKYQVDATIGDIYLVSASDSSKIIGRPTIYSVVDVFSRAIVGIYVGLGNASWTTARKALFNAFRDKVDYCAEFDIEISKDAWPCCGVPHAILADNGEFNSFQSDDLVMGLGVRLENAPPWRADLKGIVEQSFHQLNMATKTQLPGAVIKTTHTRGDENYRKNAILTLHDYTRILIYTVLHHNNSMLTKQPIIDQDYIEAGVDPIPNEIWKWGMRNRMGGITTKTELDLWIALLPRVRARITKQGIQYKNLCYTSETAVLDKWFDTHGGRIGENCDLLVDPENLESAYVVLGANHLERATRTEASRGAFCGWTENDLDEYIRNEDKKQREGAQKRIQGVLDLNAEIEKTVGEARKRNSQMQKSLKKQSGTRIRKNRKEEQEKIVEFPSLQKEKPPARNASVPVEKTIDEIRSERINSKLKRLMEDEED